MEFPRLVVYLELYLLAYATPTATAMQDPSYVCDLHHSSQKCQLLNPLSEVKDRTHNLMLLVGFGNSLGRLFLKIILNTYNLRVKGINEGDIAFKSWDILKFRI